MGSIDFHETVMGHKFFEYQLPSLIKAINRLADTQEEKQKEEKRTNENAKNIDSCLNRRILSVIDNKEKTEAFKKAFTHEIESDDEPDWRAGYYMLKAVLDNNIDDFLIAVCGWSAESLLNIAESGSAHPDTLNRDNTKE